MFRQAFHFFRKDFVPLSAGFDTMKLEKNHQRDNSYNKDVKGTLKIGYTPNATG